MTITVFLADDHAVIREGLARLLEMDAGFKVVGTAGNGRDTVTQVAALAPQVVIMDISMPDLNGIEAARQIRERHPQVRIMMLSMHSTAEHVFHALEAGVHGYLLKDSASNDIVYAIKTVQSGRRYLSPRVAEVVAEQVAQRQGLSPLESLSGREREILQLVAEGFSSAAIGTRLNLSPKTVDTYRSRLMQKLHIRDVPGLVKFAIQQGLITLD